MRNLQIIGLLTCLTLTACSSVQEGVVIQKRWRSGMADPYDLYSLDFRFEPNVYWVRVEGRDKHGRDRVRNIILFRHDWDQLRVGDHWSKQHGFSPAEATGSRHVRHIVRRAKAVVVDRSREIKGVDAAIDQEFAAINAEIWSGTWVQELFQPSGNGLLSSWKKVTILKGESRKRES